MVLVFAEFSPTTLKCVNLVGHALKPPGKQIKNTLSKLDLQMYASKVQIFEHIVELFKKSKLESSAHATGAIDFVEFLADRLLECDVTNQVADDVVPEIRRLARILQLLEMIASSSVPLASANLNAKGMYNNICKLVYSIVRYSDLTDATLQTYLTKLNELLKSSVAITEKEKVEIVRALNMEKGHWFKCPNGHHYAIGECGGAMEESKCNECGARIGGGNHQLLENNAHSSEMDGSSHAAWSEAANLANYGNLQQMFGEWR